MGNIFFERFAELCKGIGETPNSVAKTLGISSGSVTAWKNGTEPRSKTLSRLAEYFGVSTDYLLTGLHRNQATYFTNGICVYSGSSMQEIEKQLTEREIGSYKIVYRGPNVVITVDADCNPPADQLDGVIAIYAEKVPTGSGERDILDEIDIAFYGEYKELTEDDKETVRDMVRVMRERRAKRQEQ